VEVTRGSLVKWVTSHESYQSNGDILVGLDPIYKYGVVMKISNKDPDYLAVVCCDDGRWHIVNVHHDDIQIISEAKND